MQESICRYCMEPLKASDEEVSFPFSDEYVFCFHPTCYEEYKRKCNIIKVVLQHVNDHSYKNILKEIRESPTAVPNQEEDDCICPVCLTNVADTVLLPCHHKICPQCLLDWRGRTARSKQAGTRCCICRSLIEKTVSIPQPL